MTFGDRFRHLLQDPLPEFAFELSSRGIAWARPAGGVSFEPLEPGVIEVSPVADNVLRADVLADKVRAIAGASAGRKRRRTALILPDYAARVAVLEFDTFPGDAREQLGLVRFRMKKSVPFDVESAAVSYYVQPSKAGKKLDVVVVVAALEIIARYEAAFRNAGLHPGFVTTSALAMADLVHAPGISIAARLNERVLTVAVMNSGALKLVRTVELGDAIDEEILGVLFPTIAYIEDEMGAPPARLLVCGFAAGQPERWQPELNVAIEPLRSRAGTPGQHNAGLLGYLESRRREANAA